jgi:hypothetical protein
LPIQKTPRESLQSQVAEETYFSEEKDAGKAENAAVSKAAGSRRRLPPGIIESLLKARALHKSSGHKTFDKFHSRASTEGGSTASEVTKANAVLARRAEETEAIAVT